MFQVTQYKTCQILVQTFPEPSARGSPSLFNFRNRKNAGLQDSARPRMPAPGLGVDGAAAASADEYIEILLPLKPGDADSAVSSCMVALLREDQEKYPAIVQCFHGKGCAWDTQKHQFQGPPNWEAVLCRLQALVHPGGPVSTADTPTAKVTKGSPESYKRQVCWSSLPPASTKACARGECARAMRACSRGCARLRAHERA